LFLVGMEILSQVAQEPCAGLSPQDLRSGLTQTCQDEGDLLILSLAKGPKTLAVCTPAQETRRDKRTPAIFVEANGVGESRFDQ
jgi:hypothetical protein